MGEFPAERLFLVKDRKSGLDQVLPESTPLQSCAMSVHVTMLCTAALQLYLLQVCSHVAWQKKFYPWKSLFSLTFLICKHLGVPSGLRAWRLKAILFSLILGILKLGLLLNLLGPPLVDIVPGLSSWSVSVCLVLWPAPNYQNLCLPCIACVPCSSVCVLLQMAFQNHISLPGSEHSALPCASRGRLVSERRSGPRGLEAEVLSSAFWGWTRGLLSICAKPSPQQSPQRRGGAQDNTPGLVVNFSSCIPII